MIKTAFAGLLLAGFFASLVGCGPECELPTPVIPSSEYAFLNGVWTYRSLFDNPNDTVSFDSLEFAVADMTLNADASGNITGDLDMGGGYHLAITGQFESSGNPHFKMFGKGIPGSNTENWEYDYQGFISPAWSIGVNQVDALTGTVVRSKPHGIHKAGVTASFYMVRKP